MYFYRAKAHVLVQGGARSSFDTITPAGQNVSIYSAILHSSEQSRAARALVYINEGVFTRIMRTPVINGEGFEGELRGFVYNVSWPSTRDPVRPPLPPVKSPLISPPSPPLSPLLLISIENTGGSGNDPSGSTSPAFSLLLLFRATPANIINTARKTPADAHNAMTFDEPSDESASR